MIPFKAVLFDLDGTLLDTLTDIGQATNRVLARHGYPEHPMAAYRLFVGSGAKVLIERALPSSARTQGNIADCLRDFLEDYGQHWNVHTQPYEAIPTLLNALQRIPLRMAILSNKPDQPTQKLVAAHLSQWPFEAVRGHRAGAPKKPDPTTALRTVKQMNLAPSDFVYVGDTGIDMQTAVSAGMFPVGVLWGFRPREELTASGAAALISVPMDLIEILKRPAVAPTDQLSPSKKPPMEPKIDPSP